MKTENCKYIHELGVVELLGGSIRIDLYNKEVSIEIDESQHLFNAYDAPVSISISRKHSNLAIDANTFVIEGVHKSTLLIEQGDKQFVRHLDDVAPRSFINGVEAYGLKWNVDQDLGRRTFTLS